MVRSSNIQSKGGGVDKDEEKPRYVVKRYQNRLTVLKFAREYAQKDHVVKAVQGYIDYLNAVSLYYGVDEKNLSPNIFELPKDMAEILLISQVYWGLAKAYDRNEKLHSESQRCLDKFVLFSVGFKFQYLNSEMIRKFNRKNQSYNPRAFKRAYEQIQVQSKKCYIATYCFSDSHPVTQIFRDFKQSIIQFPMGVKFVSTYYRFSPKLVDFCERNRVFGQFLKRIFFRPSLVIFSKLLKKILL
ncbi:MAG: hypothetical protein ISR65_04005 [Bacteriovoracaceae bacterium]|nr:hypothetical protein [Bacteriovoracaceae bacterium]